MRKSVTPLEETTQQLHNDWKDATLGGHLKKKTSTFSVWPLGPATACWNLKCTPPLHKLILLYSVNNNNNNVRLDAAVQGEAVQSNEERQKQDETTAEVQQQNHEKQVKTTHQAIHTHRLLKQAKGNSIHKLARRTDFKTKQDNM